MNIHEERFRSALSSLGTFGICDTAREEANRQVRYGNPYLADLLRELANRIDQTPKDERGAL